MDKISCLRIPYEQIKESTKKMFTFDDSYGLKPQFNPVLFEYDDKTPHIQPVILINEQIPHEEYKALRKRLNKCCGSQPNLFKIEDQFCCICSNKKHQLDSAHAIGLFRLNDDNIDDQFDFFNKMWK